MLKLFSFRNAFKVLVNMGAERAMIIKSCNNRKIMYWNELDCYQAFSFEPHSEWIRVVCVILELQV